MGRKTLALVAVMLWGLLPGAALAQPVVAVLAFGSDDEGNVRGDVVDPLTSRYSVIHGDEVLDACDSLGIPMTRGPNLARCAVKAGAAAVVGGAIKGGKLSLVVFSGATGKVLASGAVPCGRRLSTAGLRKALAIILKGLKQAPASVGSGGRRKQPKPSESFSFDPDPVSSSGSGSGFSSGSRSRSGSRKAARQADDSDEDPISGTGTPSFDPSGGGEEEPGRQRGSEGGGGFDPDNKVEESKAAPAGDDWPRLELFVGLGTWIRDFHLNDPANTKITFSNNWSESTTHPIYNSGAPFALRLGAKVRPAAFFTDNFASWLYLRLQFQTTLGCSSNAIEFQRDPTTGAPKKNGNQYITTVKTVATTFWELQMELGLDYSILSGPTSPHLIGGLGFGLMDFSIQWDTPVASIKDTQGRLPNVGYTFLLLKLGLAWPFVQLMDRTLTLGAHFNFDFRPVLGEAGEIEDPLVWYGPASKNGLGLGLGIDGRYRISEKINLIASVEYCFTYYWFDFEQAEQRVKTDTRAAGGALDKLHGIIVNLGYAY